MSHAARAARDFASTGLAAIDTAIAAAEDGLALMRTGLRDFNAGRKVLLEELSSDAGDAATERRLAVAFLLSLAASHRPPGSGGQLDAVGLALTQAAYAIEARQHLAGQPANVTEVQIVDRDGSLLRTLPPAEPGSFVILEPGERMQIADPRDHPDYDRLTGDGRENWRHPQFPEAGQ